MTAPTKRNKRRKCAKRISYQTQAEATAAAYHLARRKALRGEPIISFLRAYGCHCGKFHIGKTSDINWDAVKQHSVPMRV